MDYTVDWRDGRIVMVDQTLLPQTYRVLEYDNYREVADAIREMKVRGAPAIGVTAAFALALAARSLPDDPSAREEAFEEACRILAATRPTAVNLFWAIEEMRAVYRVHRAQDARTLAETLLHRAKEIQREDVEANRRMGAFGASLIPEEATVLTHCNAGALATAGYGTALGVIRAAVEAGKRIQVLADETRPRLQGAMLTAYELQRDGIPVTLIADGAAAGLMRQGKIQCAVVGADRIAANGDVANKIGTYSVALACRYHRIPFYVAAPLSTIDLSLPSGEEIPIEERDANEVTHLRGEPVAPDGVDALNPAFDVTPAELVTAIITEKGIASAPYEESLKALRDTPPDQVQE
ncbi:MAG: S-methyl-5-thioribose-1-phosphate isomerase [Armatimonadetes bacterium]|nr:S-methyl-5-thioribose-1-phosphate isomerase [Armatimonadota bacterium]